MTLREFIENLREMGEEFDALDLEVVTEYQPTGEMHSPIISIGKSERDGVRRVTI